MTTDVAYLDCTGSGSETRAHLLASDDKRLTIMFCAFEGAPVILRLYGQGRSLMRGTPDYAALVPQFEEVAGRSSDRASGGRPRADLLRHGRSPVRLQGGARQPGALLDRRTASTLRKYWRLKNMKSIDGLPTNFTPDSMAPPN